MEVASLFSLASDGRTAAKVFLDASTGGAKAPDDVNNLRSMTHPPLSMDCG